MTDRTGWIAALLLAVYAACCLTLWYQPGWRPHWDSALYLLIARGLARGDGYHYLGEAFTLRPPGFSWLLSWIPLQATFDAAPFNRLVMAFAALTTCAVYAALSPSLGRPAALAAALLSGTNPILVNRFNSVLAEFPFMTALYAGFALLLRARGGRRRWLWGLGAALAFAAAFWLRTIAVLLIPALLLALLHRRWRADGRLLAMVAGVLLLTATPWFAYQQRHASDEPREQLLVADHATATFHEDPGDPGSPRLGVGALAERVATHGAWLIRQTGHTALGTRTLASGLAILCVVLAGLVLRWRRTPSPIEWFAVSYVAVVLLYWYPSARYLTTLVPLLYAYLATAIFACESGLQRRLPRLPRHALPIALALALCAANAARFREELEVRRKPMGVNRVGDDMDATFEVAAWVQEHSDPDEVVLCHDAPMISLLSGRLAYTYRFRPSLELLEKIHPDVVVVDRPGASSVRMRSWVADDALEHRRMEPNPGRTRGVDLYRLRPRDPPRG